MKIKIRYENEYQTLEVENMELDEMVKYLHFRGRKSGGL